MVVIGVSGRFLTSTQIQYIELNACYIEENRRILALDKHVNTRIIYYACFFNETKDIVKLLVNKCKTNPNPCRLGLF